MMRLGIDRRSTRAVEQARGEFRVGIRGGAPGGRSKGRPSTGAARCRPATSEQGRCQFSEAFEAGQMVGPPPEGSPPTLL